MTERGIYECDLTGERYAAKNDVITVGVKRKWSHNPFKVTEYDVHVSFDALEGRDDAPSAGALQHVEWVGVHDGEVVGHASRGSGDERPTYHERGGVVGSHSEPVLEFFEETGVWR